MKNKKLFAILTLVCFMFTLMPVAAFAANPYATLANAEDSFVYVDDTDVDVNDEVEVTVDAVAAATEVYVWFEAKTNVPTTKVSLPTQTLPTGVAVSLDVATGIYTVTTNGGDATFEVAFTEAGTYEVHASLEKPVVSTTWADAIEAIADYELQTEVGYKEVEVAADASDSDDYVIAGVTVAGATHTYPTGVTYYEDGDTIVINGVPSNGIDEVDVEFTVYEDDTMADTVYAYDVEVDSSNKVAITDLKAKRTGVVSFTAVVEKAGTHKVTVEIGDYKATIKLNANDGEAEAIEVAYVAANPVNIDGAWNDATPNLENQLRFYVYDANGNKLEDTANYGFDLAQTATNNYVSIVEQPAKSKVENDDLRLVWNATNAAWTIESTAKFTEEGTYTFKVALNDGTSVKATITLQESGDYVALTIAYATETVQLGATIAPTAVNWVDANKVTTPAPTTDVEFTASGAAVEDVNGRTITVKDDEKYIGSKIEVAVVDEDNNLIATKTLTVAAEAKELVFEVPTVPVDTTRTIGVKLVDENGKTVGLNSTTYSAYVVVLEKPADTDVTADVVNEKPNKGTFDINFSADTVGIVKLQAVLKATVDNVVRYYTGIVEVPVGAAGVEDVVVLSIGSSELIKNDTIVQIPAPAMIKEARTFVPFRAVGEAFGAEVAWDAATQSVTAELDGVTVVLTIGSNAYTVNGVEKTADAASFIAGDGYTMVPVRLIAEAFGYVVEFTTNPNGTVADVLFRG